jgi:catechol 2,3-dioxygenase-like lactoylglutathione lyase family enzyme
VVRDGLAVMVRPVADMETPRVDVIDRDVTMESVNRHLEHGAGVSAAAAFTVGVSDLGQALALFHDLMELRLEADFEADPSLLSAWHVAAGTRARVVELSCRGYPFGRVRLVEYTPTPTRKVRVHAGAGPHDGSADVGPKALDFYVSPPARTAYERVVAAGYETRSPPILHEVGDTISEEFVFWGPDGVPMLFMVGHRHAADQLRPGSPAGPFSEVATVSIVGADPDDTRRFYSGALGLRAVVDTETPEAFRDRVCELTGVPKGSRIHWLLYAAPGEASGKILVIHFGAATGRRLRDRMRPGHLGFSLLTHYVSDLDELLERLQRVGAAIVQSPTEVRWGDASRRLMLVRGPNEELFEFVERRT